MSHQHIMKSLGLSAAGLALAALWMTASAAPSTDPKPIDTISPLGNYLAGRYARSLHDTPAAAEYYSNALRMDPRNEIIMEQAFLLESAAGNWPRAFDLAKNLLKNEETDRLAHFVLAAKAAKEGNAKQAERNFDASSKGPLIWELTTRLAKAWVQQSDGRTNEALKTLDDMKKAEWSRFFQRYHRGLIADLGGRTKLAEKSFAEAFEKSPRTLRIADAYARHLVNSGNVERAKEILKLHISQTTGHPIARDLLARIEAGEKPPLLIKAASEGLAEVLYGIGDALADEGGTEMGTVFLQLALYLKPQFPLVHQSLGEVYDTSKKYEAAIEAYNRVPADSPLAMSAEIRKAYDVNSLDKPDEAKALLDKLIEAKPKETRPLEAAGIIMRARKRYEESAGYYSRAIDLLETPKKSDWSLYYARGVCRERMQQWPKAEADFKEALKLNPDEPLILNYLGYSWIDQGINVKEGLELVRKAVKLKPDDGYFVDSLGWAFYRLGEYAQAVEHLERAVELRPDDPVINDHLGDAYWRVDRKLEAEYQWSQSLTLEPEEDEAKLTKAKLKDGLPADERKAAAQAEKSGTAPKSGN
ncbi:MAG: tetratricopeptide repeat protein [Pseudomonadota bacterium]|nr:tetratricopeptide repeat protein [Pseudomonadota bacterium]